MKEIEFINNILDNLDYLINKQEEHQKESNYKALDEFMYECNLKFTKQFILEFAKKNGYR